MVECYERIQPVGADVARIPDNIHRPVEFVINFYMIKIHLDE